MVPRPFETKLRLDSETKLCLNSTPSSRFVLLLNQVISKLTIFSARNQISPIRSQDPVLHGHINNAGAWFCWWSWIAITYFMQPVLNMTPPPPHRGSLYYIRLDWYLQIFNCTKLWHLLKLYSILGFMSFGFLYFTSYRQLRQLPAPVIITSAFLSFSSWSSQTSCHTCLVKNVLQLRREIKRSLTLRSTSTAFWLNCGIDTLISGFIDEQNKILSPAIPDTVFCDPSSCPCLSSRTTPNYLLSWSEVVVCTHKKG